MPIIISIISISYFLLCLLLGVSYIFLIRRYLVDWYRLPECIVPLSYQPQSQISVIIAARNEAQSIIPCLESILNQNYPKELFEIILVDDHSDDGTKQIVERHCLSSVTVFALSDYLRADQTIQSFKKKAIGLGIQKAKGQIIVTTDADCIVPTNWLRHMEYQFVQNGVYMVAGPVSFYDERNLLERFQSLDFLGMMIITGAGISGQWMRMCNGASLAYLKSMFLKVDGFAGIDHLASGDDMLLMHKIAAQYPQKIAFIKSKDALVLTKAKSSWSSFFQQRLRWATKSRGYQEKIVTLVLAVVFLNCVLLLLGFLLLPFLGWMMILGWLFLAMVKSMADFFLLKEATRFFGRRDLRFSIGVSQLLHVMYIVIIGVAANVKRQYIWKGRKVQ